MTLSEALVIADGLWQPEFNALHQDCSLAARRVSAGAHSTKTVVRIQAELGAWLATKKEAVLKVYTRVLREARPVLSDNATEIIKKHLRDKFQKIFEIATAVLNNSKAQINVARDMAVDLIKERDLQLTALEGEVSLIVESQKIGVTRRDIEPQKLLLSNTHAVPDAFKRRYQVFVSSTYEDLVEERRHVIHALLETKCIPSGMEMFPASSEEKWTRIKRVIDDCDYFISIVAGMYGSCGSTGKSFTEMEFDYAVETEKPIMGFFHADLDGLTGRKLEKSDAARQKLEAFMSKLKGGRVCHSWREPHELASAVKSAVLHEIEVNPQTGWVRADAVVNSEVAAELKREIVALKRSPSSRQKRFAGDEDALQIPIEFVFFQDEDAASNNRWADRKAISYVHSTTWNQVFLIVGQRLVKKNSRSGVKRAFHHYLVKSLRAEIERQLGFKVYEPSCTMQPGFFEKILETFVATGLLKRVKAPREVLSRDPYWETSPKGMLKLAELKAVRSKDNNE